MSISKLVVTNLEKWVDLNRNRATTQNIMKNDSQIKIYYIGDGDERNYFHMQEAEELYFVFSGELVLRCLDSTGVSKDVHIMAGEVFLLPAKILHSVKYCENLSAIVIERERLTNEIDNLSWYAIIPNSNQKDSKFNDTIDNTNKNTSINLSDDILSYNTKQSVENIVSSDKSLTFGAPLVNRSPSPDPNAIKSIVSDSLPYTMQSQSTEALDHKTQQSADDTAPRNMNTHFSDSQPLRKKDNLATNFRIGSDEDMDIAENNQAKNETILIDTDHALNTDSSPQNVRSDLNVKSYSQPRCMLSTQQQNAYKLKQTQSLNPLLNNAVGLIGTDILCEPIPENEPLPPSPKPSVISTDHQNTQQFLSPTSSLQSTAVNIHRTGISSSVQPPQKFGQTKFFKPQPPHFSLLTKSESATNFGGSTLNSTTQQNMYNFNVNIPNPNQMSPFVPLNALKKRSPSLISNAENYHCTPGPCMKLLTQTWFHCIDTFRDIDHALQIMKLRENKRATEHPQTNSGTNTGSCTIHHPEERLTKYPNFVGDTLPVDASIGYKPCSDLEDNIHPPVAFDLWIDRRRAEINTTGCVSLFDEDDYQVKVLVYGSGEHIGRNNAADIFVWQYKGSCVLSLNVNTTTANNTNTSSGGDNKKDGAGPNYTLNVNDTLIVPRGTSYTAINTMDGLTLHIVIDPRKKT